MASVFAKGSRICPPKAIRLGAERSLVQIQSEYWERQEEADFSFDTRCIH
jgi:hypothetical protein